MAKKRTDPGKKKKKKGQKIYSDAEYLDIIDSVNNPRPIENIPGSVVKQRTDFQGTLLSKPAAHFLKTHNIFSSETGSAVNRKKAYGDVYDLYNNYFGQPLESEAVHISKYRPPNEKDPSSVYYSVQDSIFKNNILDIANDLTAKEKKAMWEGKLHNANGYRNAKAGMFATGEEEADAWATRRASTAIGRFKMGIGKDENGTYLSYYDVFDASSGNGKGARKKHTFGAARPFEIYDRIYLDDSYLDEHVNPYNFLAERGQKEKKDTKQYAVGGQTDPPGMLQTYYELMGHNKNSYSKFDSFLKTLAEAESFSGKKQDSDLSSAKGLYHYVDDAVTTSDNRIRNLLKRNKVSRVFSATLEKELKKPVQERSPEVQGIMVLSDLMEDKDAPFNDWMAGKVEDKELYYRGHHSASAKSVSSPEQVYENWDNAMTRQNTTYRNAGAASGLPGGDTSKIGDLLRKLTGGAGDFLNGDFAEDFLGGPLGVASIAGGLLSTGIESMIPGAEYNTADSTIADFDMRARNSRKEGKKIEGTNEVFDTIGNTLGEIPIVGGIGKGVTSVVKGITNLFTNQKSSKEDIMNDYMGVFRPHNQAQRKSQFANAFAAVGGEFDPYIDLFTDPSLKDAGVYEVGVGGTHEQNPSGGVSFSPNAKGGMNQAEEGEVIIDGPGGQKLVFTNKF